MSRFHETAFTLADPSCSQSAFEYGSRSDVPRSAPPSIGRTNKTPASPPAKDSAKEPCQICYGRKADALVNVRGLKICPFCKRDLLSVDVNKEVSAPFFCFT